MVKLKGINRFTWCVIAILALTFVYAILQVGFVRPYLPPAGGMASPPATDCARALPTIPRPPAVDPESGTNTTVCLATWRAAYANGELLADEPIWATDEHGRTRKDTRAEWARRHAGMIVQILVFTLGALLLFLLRSNDLTAGLIVMALALSAVSGGGPLFGVEETFPGGLGRAMTVFTWLATPLAFPVIALAILYFPARAPLLTR